jgi:hypothetical protein
MTPTEAQGRPSRSRRPLDQPFAHCGAYARRARRREAFIPNAQRRRFPLHRTKKNSRGPKAGQRERESQPFEMGAGDEPTTRRKDDGKEVMTT